MYEPSQLPERVTMPLLTLITQNSMDEDYLHVAERRAAGAPGPPSGRPHRTAAIVVAVFGIMVTTAAVQTSRNASVDDAGRNTLVSRIKDGHESVSRLQDKIVRIRERNADLEKQLAQITTTEQGAVTRLRRIQVQTGHVAVTGEGVRIIVDDPPDSEEFVRDEDLALLVNGLWSAGAEAISINGQRLTVLSAIRLSGRAIRVNRVSLSPPYTVLAIGDTRTLQANLLDTATGNEFFGLVNSLLFSFDLQNDDSLSLPAAPVRTLRFVGAGTSEDQDPPLNQENTP